MGVVWLADDESLNRAVAVKEILWPPQLGALEREILRQHGLWEAQTAARLNHPNIVGVYDVVEDDGRPWIVMQLVPYRSLGDAVRDDGPLPPGRAAQVGLQILAALGAAHAIGVLHRDVKPGNVLLGPGDRVVLTDFGMAIAGGSPALTAAAALFGSPSYMAPERARGEEASPAADLWSLGATLYAAVEGRRPFDRDSTMAVLAAVVNDDPDAPSHAGPLWPVISGLLRKDPGARPDAAEVERLLRQVAAEQGTEQGAGEGAGQETALGEPASLSGGADQRPTSHPMGEPTSPLGGTDQTPSSKLAEEPTIPLDGVDQTPSTPAKARTHSAPAEKTAPAKPRPQPAGAGSTDLRPALIPGLEPRPDVAARDAPEPDSPADALPRRSHPRLRWLVAALGGLAAAAAIAVAIGVASHNAPGHRAAPVAAKPSPTRSAGQPSTRTKAASSPPSATPGSRGPAALPAGFSWYHDPTGFSIGVPAGWHVSHEGRLVYLRDPSGGRFLLIDQTNHPRPDPLADWRQQEANRISTYPGYRRIRLQAVRYAQAERAADWEFTYYQNGQLIHVLNRNVLTNADQAYALYWSTPASEWGASFHLFRAFAATFRPAGTSQGR